MVKRSSVNLLCRCASKACATLGNIKGNEFREAEERGRAQRDGRGGTSALQRRREGSKLKDNDEVKKRGEWLTTDRIGNKTGDFVPEDRETAGIGNKMSDSVPEDREMTGIGNKMSDFVPEDRETFGIGNKMSDFVPEDREMTRIGNKMSDFVPEDREMTGSMVKKRGKSLRISQKPAQTFKNRGVQTHQ